MDSGPAALPPRTARRSRPAPVLPWADSACADPEFACTRAERTALFRWRRGPACQATGSPGFRDSLNYGTNAVLYFHFDVIAFDHDFVTWNAIVRWQPQNSAGFQVEIRTVPRTGYLGALNVAFRQRSATVRAGVADGIVSSLHIEEGYFLAFDCERSRLAGYHVLVLSYLEKFCHKCLSRLMVADRIGTSGSCQALLSWIGPL